MVRNFDDFLKLMESVIVTLCENPATKIDGQLASYDRSRHLVRVLVTTNSGDVFQGEFAPECPPDLLKDEAIPFGAAIRSYLKQQLTVAETIAAQAHQMAWKADHARRGQAH